MLAAASAQVGQARAASTALWSLGVRGCAAALPATVQISPGSPGWVSICTRCAVLICPTQNWASSASSARAMPRRKRCAGRVGCGLTLRIVTPRRRAGLVVHQVMARSHAPQGLACCGILWPHCNAAYRACSACGRCACALSITLPLLHP